MYMYVYNLVSLSYNFSSTPKTSKPTAKRGRPRKIIVEHDGNQQLKQKRGRPRKRPLIDAKVGSE